MTSNDDLKKMRSDAKKTVAAFVATTTASCTVPIPVADAVVLVGEQVTMMAAISAIYKLGLSKKTLQTLVMGALGVSGVSVIGKTIVSSAFKFIPGLGTVVGSVISASTAGALTLALGNAFVELCETVKKGNLTEADLNGKKGRDYFQKLFNRSKKDEGVCEMSYERPEGQGFAVIKKTCEIVKNGEKGILVWDYLIYNEITFVNARTQESESLFKGWSDEVAESEFARLSHMYAPNTEKSQGAENNNNGAETQVCDVDFEKCENKYGIDYTEIIISGLGGLKKMESRNIQNLNIYHEKKLIGYVEVILNEDKKLTIREIGIKEEYRGKGICSYVLKQLENLYTIEVAETVAEDQKSLD